METIEEKIKYKIEEVERKNDVRVIYACESGSRAWGFASPDSDYDVRFVYVRHPAEYMRLDKTRDVIEHELNDVFDINGWDVQKLLRLLMKSNPTIFEWASSPIVYAERTEFARLRNLLPLYFSEKRSIFHYFSMMRNNLRSYFQSDSVALKKYLYALRPLLSCRWILEKHSPPPTSFSALRSETLPRIFDGDVDALLERKKNANEAERGRRIPRLDEFIGSECERLISAIETIPQRQNPGWKALNGAFFETIASAFAPS